MSADIFNYSDRAGFLERLGRLAGSTTWRDPDAAGGTPYVTRLMSGENALALALSMARRNPRDIGPDMAYTVGTGVAHRRARVLSWLNEKLESGTGSIGHKHKRMIPGVAQHAYELIGWGETDRQMPKAIANSNASAAYDAMLNIALGWLWMSVEMAVERAEYCYRAEGRPNLLKPSETVAA